MTDSQPPIPHRPWCQGDADLYVYNDESGFVIARCRSCRAEYLDWPSDNDQSIPTKSVGVLNEGPT